MIHSGCTCVYKATLTCSIIYLCTFFLSFLSFSSIWNLVSRAIPMLLIESAHSPSSSRTRFPIPHLSYWIYSIVSLELFELLYNRIAHRLWNWHDVFCSSSCNAIWAFLIPVVESEQIFFVFHLQILVNTSCLPCKRPAEVSIPNMSTHD